MDRCVKAGWAVLLGLLTCRACLADVPPPPPAPYGQSSAAMSVPDVPYATVLKELVLKRLPGELIFEKNDNWGHQAHVPSIYKGKPVQVLRNHGNWQKMRLVCHDVPHSIRVRVEDLDYSVDRAAYTVRVSLPATLEYQHKTWQNGIQVQGSHGRARVRVTTVVTVHAPLLWTGGAASADVPHSFKVSEARVFCDRFVAENVNGIGGDVAKVTGGKLEHTLGSWKDGLQRDMLAKMQPALLQAADSQRARLALAKLVNDIAARATDLAVNPPFSSALTQPELAVLPPPRVPEILQAEPRCTQGLSFFIDIQLNGNAGRNRAVHETSFISTSTHGHFSGGGSSAGHSSNSGSSGHADHSGHTHQKNP